MGKKKALSLKILQIRMCVCISYWLSNAIILDFKVITYAINNMLSLFVYNYE